MPDNNSDWLGIQKRVESLGIYRETSESFKSLSSKAGDSLSSSFANTATQLGQLQNKTKKFQADVPTSMDQMLNLLSTTRGGGSATFKYLRKKVLETALSMESKVLQIIVDETIKALGCSYEQNYKGITLPSVNPFNYISSLPVSQGTYIPVSSIDFMGNLKIDPNGSLGKSYYEKFEPNADPIFKPYGGNINYPLNKMLNYRLNSPSTLYSRDYGNFYNGISEQRLFDITYSNTNDLGVSGDFFRVFLLDRVGSNSNNSNSTNNRVGEFLTDYYKTIKLIDPVTLVATLLNYASGFVSIKANISYRELTNKSKFDRILTRILGLCQDNRTEIDISGNAKVAEQDGLDDNFFEFSDVDLRNIENEINNIQQGVTQFESCGDVKLPVDTETLINLIDDFRDNLSGNTEQQNIETIEKIIDAFGDNPNWVPLVPSGVQINASINKDIIKNLPRAVASGILTPKVLLPIFVMISVIEQGAKNTVNSSINQVNPVIQSGNSYLSSGTTSGQQVNNLISDPVDFLKKFKTFVINCTTKINSEFLKTLFDLLKRDILNLLQTAILDIKKSAARKKYIIIIRLVQLGIIIANIIKDYRKCRNLIDDILNLLNLINSTFSRGNSIPIPLLFLTQLLPGFSSERAQINTLELLQTLGVPTGNLPDGSPNLMNQFMGSIVKGMDKEESENGTIDATVLVPPVVGGLLRVFAKKR
jgi:hypothetical protein